MCAVLVGRVSAPFRVGQCVASLARNWAANSSSGARDLTITACHAQVLLKGLPS